MLDFFRKILGQKTLNIYHLATAVVANLIFGFPSRKLRVIGVTGTDGKTTTVNMIAKILQTAGHATGFLSTINAQIGGKMIDTGLHTTTPSPFLVQRILGQMVSAGAEFAVLEVTSHSLDQFRTWGIHFETAVLTNITHEHLDYHQPRTRYTSAKFRLLRNAARQSEGTLIFNRDDRSYSEAATIAAPRVITFGLTNAASVWASDIETDLHSARFIAHTPGGQFPIALNLPGEFNVKNALAAIAVGLRYNLKEKAITQGLAELLGLAGRMEFFPTKKDFAAVVDFPPTPTAPRDLLAFLRPQVKGRLVAVFGAAGERDRTKRPEMGTVADQYADVVVLTREDNRSENAQKICEEIRKGIARKTDGRDLFIIPDRRQAIAFALKSGKNGDLVVITGNGHEQSLNVDGRELMWDDRRVVAEELAKI